MALRTKNDLQGSGRALLSAKDWLAQEQRTYAHVAGLSKGGMKVLEDCASKAIDGDRGALHPAIRLLCRADEPRQFNGLVERLDWDHPQRAWAIADALAWDAPESWQALVAVRLDDASIPDEAVGPLARCVGRRGRPLIGPLLGALEDRVGDLEAVVWALGALGVDEAQPGIYDVIQEELPGSVRQAAAIAALRVAPGEVLTFLESVVTTEGWATIPLALGGGPSRWPARLRGVEAAPSPEGALALGLFRFSDAIGRRLNWIEDDTLGAAVAEGLYILTGAELYEDGLEVHPEAESAMDMDGEPPGLRVRWRSRATWAAWLDEHGACLAETARVRIRGGRAFEPIDARKWIGSVGVESLARDWMLEELDIRYRLRSRAWSCLLERTRREALDESRAKLKNRPKVVVGDWYVAGHPRR